MKQEEKRLPNLLTFAHLRHVAVVTMGHSKLALYAGRTGASHPALSANLLASSNSASMRWKSCSKDSLVSCCSPFCQRDFCKDKTRFKTMEN